MEKPIELEGVILSILSNSLFRVELPDKSEIRARISEAMRAGFTRMLPGDRVKMEMSADRTGNARIILRLSER